MNYSNDQIGLMLDFLSAGAKQILWNIRVKKPLAGITDEMLVELFQKGLLRQDKDLLTHTDVVLLTHLGKRASEYMKVCAPGGICNNYQGHPGAHGVPVNIPVKAKKKIKSLIRKIHSEGKNARQHHRRAATRKS